MVKIGGIKLFIVVVVMYFIILFLICDMSITMTIEMFKQQISLIKDVIKKFHPISIVKSCTSSISFILDNIKITLSNVI